MKRFDRIGFDLEGKLTFFWICPGLIGPLGRVSMVRSLPKVTLSSESRSVPRRQPGVKSAQPNNLSRMPNLPAGAFSPHFSPCEHRAAAPDGAGAPQTCRAETPLDACLERFRVMPKEQATPP